MAKGLVSNEEIDKAWDMCREGKGALVEAVVRLNLLSKQVAYEELAGVYGVPFVDLKTYTCDPDVISLIDERTARELEIFPLFSIGDSLTLAVVDPSDITVMDRAAAVSKYNIEACLAAPDDIGDAVNRAYGGSGKVRQFLDTMEESYVPAIQSGESPVSQLVDLIVAQAIRDRASDIHIDPDQDSLKVRFRIDGVLYEIPPPPKYLHDFIVSRIKVISNMDIAESRTPQDGQFRTEIDGRKIEARVSSMPTIHGENIAIRLLDTEMMAIALENLGVPKPLLVTLHDMIRRPHGMIVITGPTGCGKSTTLYAALSKVRSSERHVVTIEDPVERHIKTVTQIPINEKANVTFASALRSVLRQDPDVIMVGEIRDEETAQLSVRAALTGHLVFSTLHTNDAPGVVTRLINMNIEPFLLSSSLVGVIAQRLVRCICDKCKETCETSDGLRKRLASSGVTLPKTVWRGKGCAHCKETGYSGRMGVFELMSIGPKLSDLISANVSTSQLRAQAKKDGMAGMLEDGIGKVEQGITTIEEVLRITELEIAVDSRAPVMPPEQEKAGMKPEKDAAVPGQVGLNLDDYRARMANWLKQR